MTKKLYHKYFKNAVSANEFTIATKPFFINYKYACCVD